jgi:tryptophanyl-tRNA synthetase
VDCKNALADNLITHLAPIRKRHDELKANPGEVDDILARGGEKARGIAQKTMAQVRKKLGLWS